MKTKMKQLFGILLTLALVLGLIPGMSLTAYAEDSTWTSNSLPSTSGNYKLARFWHEEVQHTFTAEEEYHVI